MSILQLSTIGKIAIAICLVSPVTGRIFAYASRLSETRYLHAGKNLAVAPELNRFVTVRISRVTPGRRYLLPFPTSLLQATRDASPDFPLRQHLAIAFRRRRVRLQ